MNRETMRSIVLLSGPVGAGKTTVAHELVACSTEPVVYIEGDTFWSFFTENVKGKSRHTNFRTIMASMTAAAMPYAIAGYEVILDFSIPPWFIDTAQRIANVRNIPLDYVVLKPDERICAARAASRPKGTIIDYTPYSELYSSFNEAGRYTIDDEASVMILAKRIRKGIDAGLFRITDSFKPGTAR